DYQLRQVGGAWQLLDKTTNAVVPMTGAGTVASPYQAAGISIVVGGGVPVNGDSFLIQPTAGAAAGLSGLLTSPPPIAAAPSLDTTPAAANTGAAVVSYSAVTNPATWVPGTYKITFTSATAYQVTDSTNAVISTGTYTSGTPITFNGGSVSL